MGLLLLVLLLRDAEFAETPDSSQPQFHGSGLGLATGRTLGFLKELNHSNVKFKTQKVLAGLQIKINTIPQNKQCTWDPQNSHPTVNFNAKYGKHG
jgi:hypothetical protein